MSNSLLIELLTEELPPRTLRLLSNSFSEQLVAEIVRHRLKDRIPAKDTFATPRRLAVLIRDVREQALDSEHEFEGPVSSDNKAVEGFSKKHQVSPESLERRNTPKGEIVVARTKMSGVRLDAVLAGIVDKVIRKLPVSKIMRWGTSDAQFVRPVHGLVMLHGSRVVPGTLFGLQSGNRTRGHRFMGADEIVLGSADEYEKKLLDEGKVLADFDKRKSEIDRQLQAEAKTQNASLGDYQALLEEVAALVEYPSVYVGEFDQVFLEIPQECLILTMRKNQRYFPLFDDAGSLLPRFLIVSNIKVADPRDIVGGNQRVVRPRLEDARFFFNQDCKKTLRERVEQLKTVVYYRDRLGTQFDRMLRIKKIAGDIAAALSVEVMKAQIAAELLKVDLLTGMVSEFPELQGVMGRYYAINDNESVEVANAIEQHYWPRFSGDRLPEDRLACVLALADKLEAIAGMFGVGQHPTGDKDHFGLRRAALGVVRILIERKLELALLPLVDSAIATMPNNAKSDWLPIQAFLLDRARSYFLDQKFSAQAIEAVLQPFGSSSPLYTLSEIVSEASRFVATEEGKILAEANKRITNILKKSGFEVPFGLSPDDLKQKPNEALFKDKAEGEFWRALQKIGGESLALKRQQRFAESLRTLSQLGKPTKSFFDDVMVNVEQPEIRDNRITLLQHARAYMNQVADLSLMVS